MTAAKERGSVSPPECWSQATYGADIFILPPSDSRPQILLAGLTKLVNAVLCQGLWKTQFCVFAEV